MSVPEVTTAVGVMSGTSADGVDAALIRIAWSGLRPSIELIAHRHEPFEPVLRDRILDAAGGAALSTADLARLHRDLAVAYTNAAVEVWRGRGVPDVIGMHGQTLAHLPAEMVTLQLGDAASVAVRTRVPVVNDFRSADVAAGGQGAPLTPFADHVLFADLAPCAIVNLGGIANVTLLVDDRMQTVRAFDTGPGNMVIDAFARMSGRPYDESGAGARRGRIIDAALHDALAHPFFARPAPKSAGREEFGADFARRLLERVHAGAGSLDDALATATELTARTVTDAIGHPSGRMAWHEVLVGGGGAANDALMERLRALMHAVPVRPTDQAGIPAAAREAVAFAILAAYRLRGLPNTIPAVTGASRAISAGALHQP